MGKHSPKGQVVQKKDQKLAAVTDTLPVDCSDEVVAAKFKEMYPEDWEKIIQRYKQHERATRAGKMHPMPEPDTYLRNMVKTYRARVKKSEQG